MVSCKKGLWYGFGMFAVVLFNISVVIRKYNTIFNGTEPCRLNRNQRLNPSCCWRRIKRIGAGVLLTASTFMTHGAELPVLEWCLDDFPNRHAYPQTGEPYGPTVEMMRELAAIAGFKLHFSPNTPFARCLKQMASGQSDLMTSLNYSEQRAATMYLLPYEQAKPEVLYLRQDHSDIGTVAQLKKYQVAMVRGYVYNARLLQNTQQQELKLLEADTLDHAFGLLLLKRVDAVIAPPKQAINIIAANPRYQGKFRIAPLELLPSTEHFVHLGFSKKSRHPQLLPALVKSLQQLIDQNRIEPLHDTDKASSTLQPVL
jgi:polar amino acid transport system substrate-binding protein